MVNREGGTNVEPPEADWLERHATGIVIGIAVIAVVLGTTILSAYVLFFHDRMISEDPADWAPFGNYIGGTLGTLFAFLALTVLLLSLEVQRRELKATRGELRKSYWQAKRHNFENTFFKLLELHKLRVDALIVSIPKYNLSVVNANATSIGRSGVFDVLWLAYIQPLLLNSAFKQSDNQRRQRRLLDFSEERFTDVVESYCNNLMEIFRTVGAWHDKETAQRFFRIFQAQMTANELRCLFAFACSERYEEMKGVIEEFSFLQSKSMFEVPKQCLALYNKKAYGDLATKLFS